MRYLFKIILLIAIYVQASSALTQTAYNPLALPTSKVLPIVSLELQARDESRGRDIPLRIYLPENKAPASVILFSHGLGGSRDNNPYLGEHWAARGYVVVFMQHTGSDEAVWKNIDPSRRMLALKQAANLQNTLARLKDVTAVIDQLEKWQVQANAQNSQNSALAGRLDLKHIGMSGHSFGAVTTQAVSGQRNARGENQFTDKRISAALAMSPNSPKTATPAQSFGAVTIPRMLMMGSNDEAFVGEADMASRLAIYPALPAGNKFELVLNGAEHSAFGDSALPGDKLPRNPKHHTSILAVSTAFWDAYLKGDTAAKNWLNSSAIKTVLDPQDGWQSK
jgi:predicted dienelactone hydrolase